MGEAAVRSSDVASGDDAWATQSLDVLLSLPGVRRAGLALLEGGGRRLTFTSAERRGAREVTWCHVDAYDDVPLNTAVRSGRVVVGSWEQLAGTHAVFVGRQDGTGTRGLAAAPLVADGRTVGAFVLFFGVAPSRSEAAVRELSALGGRLGGSLRSTHGDVHPPAAWQTVGSPDALVEQFAVPGDAAAVGPARRQLRDVLVGWATSPDTTEIATLCLSELVTNAVIHAGSGCFVHVTKHEGRITVRVRSSGSPADLPDLAAGDPMQVHGRGRQLVDALAQRWGSDLEGPDLTAWFEIEA